MSAINLGIVSPSRIDDWWLGGRYYLFHIINTIAALPDEKQIVLKDLYWQIAPEVDQYLDVRSNLSGSVIVDSDKRFFTRVRRKLKRHIFSQTNNKDLFAEHGIDVIFPVLPCDNPGVPFVYWCPDLQHLHLPELFTSERMNNMISRDQWNFNQAERIIVSSDTVRKDLLNHYVELENKVDVVHFCSTPMDDWWKCDPQQVAESLGLPERFFIVCNQFSAHKNHMVLLKAVRKLKSQGKNICLVCTGKFATYHGTDYVQKVKDYIRENSLQENIRIMGILPREQQIALIRRSLAMLQPSRFEGWSTLIEDALTLGKSIVASDIAVNREQLGQDFEYLIDLDDVDGWAQALEKHYDMILPGPNIKDEKIALERLIQKSLAYGESFVNTIIRAKTNFNG